MTVEVEVERFRADNARVDDGTRVHVLGTTARVRRIRREKTRVMTLVDDDVRDVRLVVMRQHQTRHANATLLFAKHLQTTQQIMMI